tara:strand:- start:2 stop:1861 length:1860 start_codon:yes stop_codon:yes gene_type:complete
MSNILFDIEANGLLRKSKDRTWNEELKKFEKGVIPKATTLWCIVAKDLETRKIYKFTPDELEEGIKFLQNAETLVGHNIIGYDIPLIEELYNIKLTNKVIDTLVLSRLFNPQREGGHSLEAWGHRLEFKKADQPDFDEYSEEMLEYCVVDVNVNEKVYQQLQREQAEDLFGVGFQQQSIDLEHAVARIMFAQEQNGFMLNESKVSSLLNQFKDELSRIEKKVRETFPPIKVEHKLVTPYIKKDGTLSKRGLNDDEYAELLISGDTEPFMRMKEQEFNLGSRQQIGERLMELGWKPKRFSKVTQQPTIDELAIESMNKFKEGALIGEYLVFQKRVSQIQSWLDCLYEPDYSKKMYESDRVHGYVNPNGAVTGRMTHSNPNMAQVPSVSSPFGTECRSCWIVPEGYKLVGIDASGLEIRILAHYMKDKEYVNEIINGDIHTTNQKLAGIKSRDQAKTFIYAFVYGAGAIKLSKILETNEAQGKEIATRFLRNLPSLKSLRERAEHTARSRKYLKGLDGRKVAVRQTKSFPSNALNTLVQSAGAVVMKQALIFLDQYIKNEGLDAKFVGNIHDEWQLEVKDTDADKVGQLGVIALQKAGEHFNLFCPLDGEYKIGDNWSETH